MEKLYERLSQVQKELNINSNTLAQILGVTPATVSNWINNKKSPSLSLLVMLCLELNISTCWLINGKGPMFLKGPVYITDEESAFILSLREQGNNGIDTVLEFIARMIGLNSVEALIQATYSHRILDSIGVPMIILNEEFRILSSNAGFRSLARLNEVEAELIRNTSILDWLANECKADVILACKRAEKTLSCESLNVSMIQKEQKKNLSLNMNIVSFSRNAITNFAIYLIPILE